MKIAILNEADEPRVVLVPDSVKKLVELKQQVYVEQGAGHQAMVADEAYEIAGASVADRDTVLADTELLLSIRRPSEEILSKMKGKAVVSSFEPFNNPAVYDLLSKYELTAFSFDMIPRTTLAQSMDILSSQASIAGYKAVLQAADHLPRYFPMLTTAAGSIPPAKVLILGAGVAGLQAIATAKRLGAVVEAFDTRAAAKEEVLSLGAKFVEVEGAQDDKSAGGYAVEQTEEYKAKQQALISEKASKADVVITTAQLRGKKAPLLIPKKVVESMKAGSVVVDLAASTGGNCEVTENRKVKQHHGVTIIGDSNLPAKMPANASQLYSKNVFNFLALMFDKEGQFTPDLENEILGGACLTWKGDTRK